MADIETTVSPPVDMLVATGLKLRNAARGVYYDSSATISGAVGTIDFAGEAIKRYTVTGSLTGAFAFPPVNIPSLEADNQSVVLTIVFIQDVAGGHSIPLATLFSGFTDPAPIGIPLVDLTSNGVTIVDLVARRVSGAIEYSVSFSPTFDGSQIDSGIISADRLPTASSVASGIVSISSGSSAAAAGNHTHPVFHVARVTIRMSDGGTITNGDYELLDMPASGTIIRLTRLKLVGTATPTATVTAKISGTLVTGTGTAVSETESSDSTATATNTFVARQLMQLNISAVTGTPTMLSGYIHYTINTEAWAG